MNKDKPSKKIYGILKSQSAVYNLSKNRITIGRSKTCTIIINNPSVSKDHAVIEFDEDLIASIKDLNSSNGTFVNGTRLKNSPVTIKTNDKITFGKDQNEFVFESFSSENDKTVRESLEMYDGKVSLVNDNEYQATKIDHFKNKYNFDNEKNKIERSARSGNKNTNNDSPRFLNNRKEENIKINNQNSHVNSIQNENNNNLNNNELSSPFEQEKITLQSNIDILTKDKNDLLAKLETKEAEMKKLNDLFDQLGEEYSKLNSKHNALMVYASDLQKKLDLLDLELSDYKTKDNKNKDFGKILNEKDNIISILQNEANFYKQKMQSLNLQNINYPKNVSTEPSPSIEKKVNDLIDDYVKENKKLKEQIEYQNIKINQLNSLINDSNPNDNFIQFEQQVNDQINNFNNIISIYNDKLTECVNNITQMFQGDKKEEAAKYLVEQVKYFMNENQKLMSENAKLKAENTEEKLELTNLKSKQMIQSNNNLVSMNMNKSNKPYIPSQNNDAINTLQNKVENLENAIEKYRLNSLQSVSDCQYNNNFTLSNNNMLSVKKDDNNVKECLISAVNELKEKEKIIEDLKNKLKDTISNTNMNFDERQIVSSVSRTLREKDNIIQNLQNQIGNKDVMSNHSKVNSVACSNINKSENCKEENNSIHFNS